MNTIRLERWITTLFLVLLVAVVAASAVETRAEQKRGVAFHLDSEDHMNRGLRQIARQLEAMPDTPIHVIMVAGAVNALLDGAKDPNEGLYSAQLEQLLAQGVRIFACENTLDSFNKTPDDLTFGIETVRSGIVALTQRQLELNFAYQKL